MGVWGPWPRPQMGSQGSSCQQLMGPLTNTIEEAGGAFNLALPPAGPQGPGSSGLAGRAGNRCLKTHRTSLAISPALPAALAGRRGWELSAEAPPSLTRGC